MRHVLGVVLCLLIVPCGAFAQKQADWSQVEDALGRPGKLDAGVYKVTFPRTDLHVRIGNTSVEPAAGLTSWMAFRQDSGGAVVNGDLALREAEVTPVVSTLALNGFEVSAIHNHLMAERPAHHVRALLCPGRARQTGDRAQERPGADAHTPRARGFGSQAVL